jgi:hypothetical protein
VFFLGLFCGVYFEGVVAAAGAGVLAAGVLAAGVLLLEEVESEDDELAGVLEFDPLSELDPPSLEPPDFAVDLLP